MQLPMSRGPRKGAEKPRMDDSRIQKLRKTLRIDEYSPEEWAARRSHRLLCFSNVVPREQDPELHDWLERLLEITGDEARLESVRRTHLSAEEFAALERELEEQERDWERQFEACARLERTAKFRGQSR